MSFAFKQFSIDDGHSAMKVGTDGVLLGAWCSIPESGRILDIGCGSGIVALMSAQRSSEQIKIDAVEIDSGAAEDARTNFRNSPWHDRLKLSCCDFVSYASGCKVKYDAIVSNPPYFQNSLKPQQAERSLARHTSSLEYDGLFLWSEKLLTKKGKISLITPWENYCDIARAATENRLFLYRRADIYTTAEDSTPKRVLTEWSRNVSDYRWEKIIINLTPGTYSAEYRKLVEGFYINM